MPRRKFSKSAALEAVNAVWVGQSMTHQQLVDALEAAGNEGALDQLQALKDSREIVGVVVFDEETNKVTHTYQRGNS